jgi:hypothetical protein
VAALPAAALDEIGENMSIVYACGLPKIRVRRGIDDWG